MSDADKIVAAIFTAGMCYGKEHNHAKYLETYDAFIKLMKAREKTSAACCPNNPGVTYSRRNHYVDPSWSLHERIDYIFASRDLAAHACSVVFDGTNGLDLVSDHFGVFCNVTFR
jgi:endonuclease/exonuclease/phosphatase family metal-dependent hydrolase